MAKYLTISISFAMILSMTEQGKTQTQQTEVFDQDSLTAADIAPYDWATDMGGKQLPDAQVFDFSAAQQARLDKVPSKQEVREILTGVSGEQPRSLVAQEDHGYEEVLPPVDEASVLGKIVFRTGMAAVGLAGMYFATNGFKTPADNAVGVADFLSSTLGR